MSWDDGLSLEQRQAAGHRGSSARVLAGPGTGKTRALIQRVAYLLQEQRIPSDQIVALTFTRAAARELESRLMESLGIAEAKLPTIGTLHSFAFRLLWRYQAEAGLIQPLRVADDFEEQNVLFPELGEIIGKPAGEVKKALKAYEATWNTLNQDHEVWQTVDFRRSLETALRDWTRFYGCVLRGELVYRLLKLIDGNPLIGQQMGFQHVLVDEYQDLNHCDQQVIARLEEFGAYLFVVGDDDQSIYQFRHAYPDGIRQFVADRPGCGDYQLVVCHRCPQNIVNLARSLIAWDRSRVARSLISEPSTPPGEVHTLQFRGYAAEADGIAAICKAYVNAGLLQPQDISILLPTPRLADRIIQALDAVSLSPTVLMHLWPLDEPCGRRIYCVLRLLVDRHDALALRTWLGLQRGIGLKTIAGIRKYCRAHSPNLWDGLQVIAGNPTILAGGKDVKPHFDRLFALLDQTQSLETLQKVVDTLLESDANTVSTSAAQVRQFLESLIQDEGIETANELVRFLQTYDIQAETQLQANAVRVMTMHKAKGLSSELVIIPGLEQDLLPGRHGEELARRMMYVAMTRAQRTLILTHALTRTGTQSYLGTGGGQDRRQRSQFLDEMGIRSVNGQVFVNNLGARLAALSERQQQNVNTAVLRQLIKEAFSDEELTDFCYDNFRDAYHQFGTGMSKTVKIQRLIEYCVSRVQVGVLLQHVQGANPAQYAQFEARITK